MSSVTVPQDLVIGVDIGDTKVAAGLVEPSEIVLPHARTRRSAMTAPPPH